MRHYFKQRIEIQFRNVFSDMFLFSWSYPFDKVKQIEGYYADIATNLKPKVAEHERVPIDGIEAVTKFIENKDGDENILTMRSGSVLKMPPDMNKREYEIVLAQLTVFRMRFDENIHIEVTHKAE